MSSEFDIDTSAESPELLETAREQLRETPETRKAGFAKLSELLAENKDLNYPDTEEFMEIILRCCHWYPEGAIKLLRGIAEFRRDHEKVLQDLLPASMEKFLTEGNVVNVLKNKDHLGRRIMVVNCGKVWDPDVCPSDQVFRLFYLVHIVSQLEKSTQINGSVVVMDFDGLSMKQVKALTPAYTKRLLTFIQDAMPLRLREVHFVKQPFIFNMVWQLFKPFVKEKLKNRMFFHGADMKKLHKHIPAEFWPSNYGGTLPEIDYSGKDWYPAVVKRNQLYVDWATYGFK